MDASFDRVCRAMTNEDVGEEKEEGRKVQIGLGTRYSYVGFYVRTVQYRRNGVRRLRYRQTYYV